VWSIYGFSHLLRLLEKLPSILCPVFQIYNFIINNENTNNENDNEKTNSDNLNEDVKKQVLQFMSNINNFNLILNKLILFFFFVNLFYFLFNRFLDSISPLFSNQYTFTSFYLTIKIYFSLFLSFFFKATFFETEKASFLKQISGFFFLLLYFIIISFLFNMIKKYKDLKNKIEYSYEEQNSKSDIV
jgi:hypothetical protein